MGDEASELLQTARRRAGLTQRGLAAASGVPQPTISRIESAHMSPTYGLLDRLLRACGMEMVALDRPHEDAVDRSLIRVRLRLTPGERLDRSVLEWRKTAPFRRQAS